MSLGLRVRRSEAKDGNFALEFIFGIEPSLENQAKMYEALFDRGVFDVQIEKEIVKLGFKSKLELMEKLRPELIKRFVHRAPGVYYFKVYKQGRLKEEFV